MNHAIVSASVAVYARVSSERQAQAHTIASQLAALRERVAHDQFEWNESRCFVDDGVSGSTLLRPALERLRDAAYAGLFDRLYVLAPDRLARKHAHLMVIIEELQGCGVELVFLNRAIGDSAEDQLLLQVQGVVAEYERAKIQERSRRGKRHAAQRGRVFSTAPYGYRYVPATADTSARFEIVPDEARVVEQIFAWVARERCSMRELCRRLEKQGFRTRTGRSAWEPATIAGVLKNPAYCGRAAFGKTRMGERRPRLRPQRGRPEVPRRPAVSHARPREEWIEVPVPAIVSPECFEAVAEQLHENRQRCRARRDGAGQLLQGLVVCQSCGYACYGQSSRRVARTSSRRVRLARPYGYYRCIGKDRRRNDGQRICHNPSVPLEALEAAVWQDVRALLADPARVQAEYQRRLAEDGQPSQQARPQLSARPLGHVSSCPRRSRSRPWDVSRQFSDRRLGQKFEWPDLNGQTWFRQRNSSEGTHTRPNCEFRFWSAGT
ncbi:MAG: recombinase family protein [Planctomycetes bacterium]|nr:recombinase family protein [Planctomycetota bacterium]